MKLLLDTHVWLWWQLAPERLASSTKEAIGSLDNEVLLSAVSSWEMALKIAAGKLQLPRPLSEMVPESLLQDGFINLPIQPAHCYVLMELPMHHRDPFDRMLIAQALVEDCTLVTADRQIQFYSARILRA